MKTENCSCIACDEDTYEEYLTECLGEIQVGNLVFDAGRIIRELDPIAFRCGMADETCAQEEEQCNA